jgi:alkylation response protein AidB-like acyl-CoA dehydrogenase
MDGHVAIAPVSDAVERARSVVQKLRAASKSIETEREIPADMLDALHDARLFRLLLPKWLDGDELDPVSLATVTETIAAADASTAWCIGQGAGCAMSAAYLSREAAQRIFGPRNAVLAWGAGAQGRASRVDGGYRVTGKWMFASGSRHATWLGGHSILVGADGQPQSNADGQPIEITALFPRSKATIHDVWQVVGLKGTGSDSYEVNDLFVPADEMITRDGADSLREPAPCYRFPSTLTYAAGFASLMLGIARGALGDLKDLAMTKTPRGASSSLRDSQVFHSQLGLLEARLRSARAYHFQTVADVWSSVVDGNAMTLDQRIDLRLAATHAINEGVDIVTQAYRAAGQSAIFENAPFERRMRDALSASQQVQGRPSHYMTVGRHFVGLEPDTWMFI